MREIFINYRRIDTMESGGHLYADLGRLFGKSTVFMDTQEGSIAWGANWPNEIKAALENSEVLVVLIGPQWTTCERSPGLRRLDAPDDWVRNEIAAALRQSKKVLPVLFRRETPPSEDDLPQELKDLGFHDIMAYPISEGRWEGGTEQLVKALKEVPKLNELHGIATGEQGLRLLEQLIRHNPRVADAVSRSQALIETADRGVDEIRLLKNVHDALHEIESKSFMPIRKELLDFERANTGKTVTPRTLGSAHRMFVRKQSEIEASLAELTIVVGGVNVLLEFDLAPQLRSGAEAFANVPKTGETADFYDLVNTLAELGGTLPMRLNDEIERATKKLELRRLLELLKIVQGVLEPTARANRQLKPMIARVTELDGDHGNLILYVRDHGLLQILDNKLRSMFGGQYTAGTWENAKRSNLSNDWKAIRRLRARFTEPFSQAFMPNRQQGLEEIEAGIEAAFEGGDEVRDILDLLDEYSNEVGNLFRTVDRELKEFCAKLREKTQLVKVIFEQSQPET